MAPARCSRCRWLLLSTAVSLLSLTSCSSRPALHYSVTVSNTLPRRMTIELSVTGLNGPYLDLVGHSPTDIMQVEDLQVRSGDGHLLRWTERPETVRVQGAPLRL